MRFSRMRFEIDSLEGEDRRVPVYQRHVSAPQIRTIRNGSGPLLLSQTREREDASETKEEERIRPSNSQTNVLRSHTIKDEGFRGSTSHYSKPRRELQSALSLFPPTFFLNLISPTHLSPLPSRKPPPNPHRSSPPPRSHFHQLGQKKKKHQSVFDASFCFASLPPVPWTRLDSPSPFSANPLSSTILSLRGKIEGPSCKEKVTL